MTPNDEKYVVQRQPMLPTDVLLTSAAFGIVSSRRGIFNSGIQSSKSAKRSSKNKPLTPLKRPDFVPDPAFLFGNA